MSSSEPLFPDSGPSSSPLRPSLFELLAQEQLQDLLHPVVRYILSYFTQRYPRYLLRFLNHHEEFYAALSLLIERHHLKKHNASLSEHFYQLRLTPTRAIPTPRLSSVQQVGRKKLSRKQRWRLLMFLVGLPYIRARAQDYYERLGGNGRNDGSDEPPELASTTAQKTFKTLYSYLNLSLDLTLLSYDLLYLFDKTSSYRPWHSWLHLRVERKGPETQLLDTSNTSLLSQLPPLLPPLLLLLKLSQWWYSPSSPRTLSTLTADKNTIASTHARILPPRPLPLLPNSGLLPLTPPSTPPEDKINPMSSGSKGFSVSKDEYGICPLCKRKWQNPAVLPSGWVVCWRCGWDAVEGEEEEEDGAVDERKEKGSGSDEKEEKGVSRKEHGGRKGRCPFTGVAVGPGELRRVLV